MSWGQHHGTEGSSRRGLPCLRGNIMAHRGTLGGSSVSWGNAMSCMGTQEGPPCPGGNITSCMGTQEGPPCPGTP